MLTDLRDQILKVNWIQENGIKHWGTIGDGWGNSCISSGLGQGCAAKVLKGEDY
ncbi:MAG: hypothetical protein V2B14_01735 [bacterium]